MSLADTSAGPLRVFIGTYTSNSSRGIYSLLMDTQTGALSEPQLAAELPDPTFLAVSADRKTLFAASESKGAVYSFQIDPADALVSLGSQSSGGGGSCHVAIDPQGTRLAVANYGGGSVAVFPILPSGALGPREGFSQHHGKSVNPQRQNEPHAHGVTFSPDGKFLLVPDLGLDQVKIYRCDPSGGLVPNDPPYFSLPPGSGPRHVSFSQDGHQLYTLTEMRNAVVVGSFDPTTGAVRALQTVPTLLANYSGESTGAEILVHDSDKFVFASNRGQNDIAIFSRALDTGELKPIGHTSVQGKTPRHFMLSPDGSWLVAANQDSDSLVVFRVDRQTGELTPAGHSVHLSKPVCVVFAP